MEQVTAKIIPFTDIPTLITCKSGGFEKKPRKTWRLGGQPWRLKKYASNWNNNDWLFDSEYSFAAFFAELRRFSSGLNLNSARFPLGTLTSLPVNSREFPPVYGRNDYLFFFSCEPCWTASPPLQQWDMERLLLLESSGRTCSELNGKLTLFFYLKMNH